VRVERGRQEWLGWGVVNATIPNGFMEKRFHRRGGWNNSVVAFFVSSGSQDFPREAEKIVKKSRSKIRRWKNRGLVGFDLLRLSHYKPCCAVPGSIVTSVSVNPVP
jgi:hypothetical protein